MKPGIFGMLVALSAGLGMVLCPSCSSQPTSDSIVIRPHPPLLPERELVTVLLLRHKAEAAWARARALRGTSDRADRLVRSGGNTLAEARDAFSIGRFAKAERRYKDLLAICSQITAPTTRPTTRPASDILTWKTAAEQAWLQIEDRARPAWEFYHLWSSVWPLKDRAEKAFEEENYSESQLYYALLIAKIDQMGLRTPASQVPRRTLQLARAIALKHKAERPKWHADYAWPVIEALREIADKAFGEKDFRTARDRYEELLRKLSKVVGRPLGRVLEDGSLEFGELELVVLRRRLAGAWPEAKRIKEQADEAFRNNDYDKARKLYERFWGVTALTAPGGKPLVLQRRAPGRELATLVLLRHEAEAAWARARPLRGTSDRADRLVRSGEKALAEARHAFYMGRFAKAESKYKGLLAICSQIRGPATRPTTQPTSAPAEYE